MVAAVPSPSRSSSSRRGNSRRAGRGAILRTITRPRRRPPAIDPVAGRRAAPRSLLRNGIDYLGYKDYTRALRFLRAAEAGEARAAQNDKSILDGDEVRSLKQSIIQAQAGLREPAPSDLASRSPAARRRAWRRPRPRPRPPPAARAATGIQLAGNEQAGPGLGSRPGRPALGRRPCSRRRWPQALECCGRPPAPRRPEPAVERASAEPAPLDAPPALPEPGGSLPDPVPAPASAAVAASAPAALPDLPATAPAPASEPAPIPAPAALPDLSPAPTPESAPIAPPAAAPAPAGTAGR